MTASAFIAATLLRTCRRLHAFNATQLELHERWWQRYGSVPTGG